MKTSNKIVLIGFGVIAVLISARLIAAKIHRGSDLQRAGNEVAENLEYKDFDTIIINNSWSVSITQSSSYYVDISYPKKLSDHIETQVKDQILRIGLNKSFNFDSSGSRPTINIGMPELKSLMLEGAGDINIDGFEQKSMQLVLNGAARLEAEDSTIETLEVEIAGAGKMDLSGIKAVDAIVNLDGVGQVELYMDGGTLEGQISGIGKVVYQGTIKANNITVDGLGSVKEKK